MTDSRTDVNTIQFVHSFPINSQEKKTFLIFDRVFEELERAGRKNSGQCLEQPCDERSAVDPYRLNVPQGPSWFK
jgi:hypothetical protein